MVAASAPAKQGRRRQAPKARPDHRTRVGEARRQQMRMRLLEAAMLVFTRRGVEGRVIEAVIEAAEVSRGTFYNYFPSTEALLEAVAGEVGDALMQVVDPVVRPIADPAARVACGIRLALSVAHDHPQLASFLARVGTPALSAQSLATEVLPRDIAQGIATGRFAAMHPRLGLDLITGPVFAAFHTLLSTEVPASYIADMAAAILQSLGMAKASARRLANLPLPEIVLSSESLFVRVEARAARIAHSARTGVMP
jgi:AcrR family transcriptional regulator